MIKFIKYFLIPLNIAILISNIYYNNWLYAVTNAIQTVIWFAFLYNDKKNKEIESDMQDIEKEINKTKIIISQSIINKYQNN